MDTLQNPARPRSSRAGRHPLRLTALLDLSQALREERYEDCAEIIAIAREFGAGENEVRSLLEDRRRVPGG